MESFDITTGIDLGSVPLQNGTTSLSTSRLIVGSHAVTVTYSGAAGFLCSSGSTSLTVMPSASLSGIVFAAFNDDGQVDLGEAGIAGVSITLTGTDDLGNPSTCRCSLPTPTSQERGARKGDMHCARKLGKGV